MPLDLKRRPNALPWPPICFGGAIIVALILSFSSPWPIGLSGPERVVGLVLLAVGLALHQWATRTMKATRTNIAPNRAAENLLDFGPFAISRNPIYVGDTFSLVGLGLAIDSCWTLMAAVVAVTLVWVLAIRREEAHMAIRFGASWDRYKARTPRWLGPSSFRRLKTP